MSAAPERIWANGLGGCTTREDAEYVGYIRADVAERENAELRAWRVEASDQIVALTRQLAALNDRAEAAERENAELRAKLRAIRDKIPMNYLQRHDPAGLAGPTDKLDLVAAVKDYSADRWKLIGRVKTADDRAEAAERQLAELAARSGVPEGWQASAC